MSDSHVKIIPDGGAVFVGPDAVALFRNRTLATALRLLAVGIRPSRHLTLTHALALASQVTGKPYKRTEALAARADLLAWCAAMACALPIVTEDSSNVR